MSKPRFKPKSVWMQFTFFPFPHTASTIYAHAPTKHPGALWIIISRTSDDEHVLWSWNVFPWDWNHEQAPASWVFIPILFMTSSREWLNKSGLIILPPFHSTENELIQSSSRFLCPLVKPTIHPHGQINCKQTALKS